MLFIPTKSGCEADVFANGLCTFDNKLHIIYRFWLGQAESSERLVEDPGKGIAWMGYSWWIGGSVSCYVAVPS